MESGPDGRKRMKRTEWGGRRRTEGTKRIQWVASPQGGALRIADGGEKVSQSHDQPDLPGLGGRLVVRIRGRGRRTTRPKSPTTTRTSTAALEEEGSPPK